MQSPIFTINLLENGLLSQKEVNFLGLPVLKERVTNGRFTRYDFAYLYYRQGFRFGLDAGRNVRLFNM